MDIVERLNEPDVHYPGNFDTPKRANALLMCICQEAADEITRLRAKLKMAEQCFEMIIGTRYCVDSLMSNTEIATEALSKLRETP